MFRIETSNLGITYTKGQLVYSNNYKGIASQTGRTNFDIYLRTDNTISLDILDNRYTTTNDFKTWLQSNKAKVYYVLANTTYTLIDNEELLNQLEAVQLQTGENNVLVSGDLPMILDLSKYIQIAENHL